MIVTFLSPLRLEKIDGERWKVLEQFAVQVDAAQIFVPAGYETDLSSVPRLPLAFLLAGGRAPKSATVHDWLYEIQAGRDYADLVFRQAMKAEGVPSWIAQAMYLAVRVGGESRYG